MHIPDQLFDNLKCERSGRRNGNAPHVNSFHTIYDAANRLKQVINDADGQVWQKFNYGSSNQRLTLEDVTSNQITFYAWAGSSTLAEYTTTDWNNPSNGLSWAKSYVYLGSNLLSTVTPSGQGEFIEYNHPDRLGTRLISNPHDGTSFEQATLPFGNVLASEATGTINRTFTSYDRNGRTGLDYAINRTYDSSQGRFTQVDPIGMRAVSLITPQTLNLYSYCANDPINHLDPDGLFFGKLFKWLGKLFKGIANAVVTVAKKAVNFVKNNWKTIVALAAVVAISFIIPGAGPLALGFVEGSVGIGTMIANSLAQTLLFVNIQLSLSSFNDDGTIDDDDEPIRVETRVKRCQGDWWCMFKEVGKEAIEVFKDIMWPWDWFGDDDDNEAYAKWTCTATNGYLRKHTWNEKKKKHEYWGEVSLYEASGGAVSELTVVVYADHKRQADSRGRDAAFKLLNNVYAKKYSNRTNKPGSYYYTGKHYNNSDIHCSR